MNYFFTADEHYGHYNAIKHNNRPFGSVDEMNEGLIQRHNNKVSDSTNNLTIHCGDFHWARKYQYTVDIIKRLNGRHVFLRGSHDSWMNDSSKFFHERWEKNINGQFVVCDHYSHRVWPRSHYGAWMLFGHSHGKLPPFGKSFDVGVDNHDYEPLSFDEVCVIMDTLDDNFNLIRK